MRCTFIPPYLLRRLAEGGNATDHHTLRLDEELRQRRIAPVPTFRTGTRIGSSTRVIYDAHNDEKLPGTVARQGDPATGDPAVDEAWDHAGLVWQLFDEEFQRRSVDDQATPLRISVHYGDHYDNAFWDGRQLVFGDGDGQIFDRFTKPVDVLAHEFTHGVIQHTAALAYQGQSGALNESVCDVFACLTKQRQLGQTATAADWLIGDGIFLPGVRARALRSMTAPGTAYDDPRLGVDPQVGSMADYVETDADNGGVHLNSGIPNRAFALAAIALGGHSWERAGRLWYDALTRGEVGPQTDFRGFAEATVHSAERLFPDDELVAAAVHNGWQTVGVLSWPAMPAPVAPAQEPPPAPLAHRVAVRRFGGYAGVLQTGELDLDDDEPRVVEVRNLLTTVDPQAIRSTPPAPDRFSYTLEYGPHTLRVSEPDLTPELYRVVQIVLGQ